MSWKSLASPLAIIIVGVAITLGALAAPDSNTGARPQRQDYPEPTATQDAYPNPDTSTTPIATAATTTTVTITATSEATASTALATPSPSATSPGQARISPTTDLEPIGEAATPEESVAEVTPTPSDTLTCVPGEPVAISGEGPPRAAFLLYFNQRVVSGGSVAPSGHFAIPLVVGQERPGSYPVVVRIRGTTQVLRELTCEVPAMPAPTPVRGLP